MTAVHRFRFLTIFFSLDFMHYRQMISTWVNRNLSLSLLFLKLFLSKLKRYRTNISEITKGQRHSQLLMSCFVIIVSWNSLLSWDFPFKTIHLPYLHYTLITLSCGFSYHNTDNARSTIQLNLIGCTRKRRQGEKHVHKSHITHYTLHTHLVLKYTHKKHT